MDEATKLTWRKGSKSYNDGHCVEVAWTGQHVLIRDSKNATGPKLELSMEAWASFIKDMKDDPVGYSL